MTVNKDQCLPSTTGEPVEPCVDPDEIEAHRLRESEAEPWWPEILGIVVAIIVIVLVFAPVGVGK